MAQVAKRLRQQQSGVGRPKRLAVDLGNDLDHHAPGFSERRLHRLQALLNELAVAFDVTTDIDERSTMTGETQARAKLLDHLQRAQELADRVGRPTVVVVQ